MSVNYYYDLSDTNKLSTDTEGCLVRLCDTCYHLFEKDYELQHASECDLDESCEHCGITCTDLDLNHDHLPLKLARSMYFTFIGN